jgi:hypothetical protein
MRLVSENSDAELARRRALERVEAALHELGANMLRVIRGAGRPYELGSQASEFSLAMQAHFDAARMYPSSDELAEMLSISHDFSSHRMDEIDRQRYHDEERIIRGALQIAASRLLRQRTQEAAGSRDLWKGLMSQVDSWIAVREERAAAEKLARSVARKRAVAKKKPVKKAKAKPAP